MASRVGLLALPAIVVCLSLRQPCRDEPRAGLPSISSASTRASARRPSAGATGRTRERRADTLRGRSAPAPVLRRSSDSTARHPLGSIADTSLVRGASRPGTRRPRRAPRLGRLRTRGTRSASGGFYRVRDTGLRCVRAPCFSYGVIQVNGSTRTRCLAGRPRSREATRASRSSSARAELFDNGVYARGRFGREVQWRPRVPRDAALPQIAAPRA